MKSKHKNINGTSFSVRPCVQIQYNEEIFNDNFYRSGLKVTCNLLYSSVKPLLSMRSKFPTKHKLVLKCKTGISIQRVV
jgi:hypothetical protein